MIRMSRFDKEYYERQYNLGKIPTRESKIMTSLSGISRLLSPNSQEDIIIGFLEPGKGDKIADVGCGLGGFCYKLSRFGSETFGLDISDFAISQAQKSYERDNLHFQCVDVSNMDFEDVFDKVVNMYMLEHLTKEESIRLLSKMYNSLVKNGIIVVAVPIEEGNFIRKSIRYLIKGTIVHDPTHVRSITLADIIGELKVAGFKIEDINTFSYATGIKSLHKTVPFLGKKLLTNAIIKARKI